MYVGRGMEGNGYLYASGRTVLHARSTTLVKQYCSPPCLSCHCIWYIDRGMDGDL